MYMCNVYTVTYTVYLRVLNGYDLNITIVKEGVC